MGDGRPQAIRYSAFISYNHKDERWARWLHRELERYRLPKAVLGRTTPWGPLERRLPPVFRDRDELAASSDLASSVRQALAEASSLIVICSSNGARSRWVNEEVKEFVAMGRREHVQCLIVPEEEGTNNARELDLFPPALLELGGEPLAADARERADGKRAAFLKLVAGIIGVRFDELRQREQTRRQKRLLALASAASVGFVLMSGLSAFALLSRAEAVHERDIARQKSVTAERTTDFVKGLFYVSDPSEAQGKKITAVEVLDRGAREIQGGLGNEPDVKAELISTLSEVYLGLGSFRRADDLIRGSLSLNVSNPETRARQLSVLAASRAVQDDYGQADRIFEQTLARLGQPDKLRNPDLYSQLLTGRAEALAHLARYAEARRLIARALAWDRAHQGERSPNVAHDLETLGLTEQLAGHYDGSTRNYLSALAIRQETGGHLHPKVSEDLNQLSANAYFQGNRAAAETYVRRSLAFDEQVIGPNHPDFASSLNNFARLLLEERKFGEALPLLRRSAAIYLSQRDATHEDLSIIFSNLALALRGLGHDAEAESYFRKALAAAETHKNRMIAPILTDLADLLCAHGKTDEAALMLSRAGPIMRERYPDQPWRLAWIDNTRGACLLRQGDSAGKAIILTSAPVVLKQWNLQSLYGFQVEQRLRSAQSHS